MKITYYDILSHLIPATFLVFFFKTFSVEHSYCFEFFNDFDVIGYVAVIFVLGFLISSISNFFELLFDRCKLTRKLSPEYYMFDVKYANYFNCFVYDKNYNRDYKQRRERYSNLRKTAYSNEKMNKLNTFKAQASFARNISFVFITCFICSFFGEIILDNLPIKILLIIAYLISLYRYFWSRSRYINEIFCNTESIS